MLQETGEIRNLIWLSKPPVLGDPSKVRGEGQSHPFFLWLAFVSLYTSRRTHSQRVAAHPVETHKPVCCVPRQADREEKVADDTFWEDDCATMLCSQMIQEGLVTSVCNLLLPSMHYSPGPVGPLCDPLLSQRERARQDRARGRTLRKNREHKMSGCVMSDRNGANLSPGG